MQSSAAFLILFTALRWVGDWDVAGISVVELLVVHQLWADDGLVTEKTVPVRLHSNQSLSVRARPWVVLASLVVIWESTLYGEIAVCRAAESLGRKFSRLMLPSSMWWNDFSPARIFLSRWFGRFTCSVWVSWWLRCLLFYSALRISVCLMLSPGCVREFCISLCCCISRFRCASRGWCG